MSPPIFRPLAKVCSFASLGLVALGCALWDGSEPRLWKSGEVAARLAIEGLDESSGVAASFEEPGWFYTHNDDGPVLQFWKFNLKGEWKGPFNVPGIANRDMEDMASQKGPNGGRLFFADIGDNAGRYDSIRVVQCPEPKSGRPLRAEVFELTYPDGPRNAEAFFVEPKTGDFWIVEKTSAAPANVYVCRNPKPGTNRLALAGSLRLPGAIPAMRLVTGAAVSPDGRYVAIRTYTSGYEFPTGASFARWMEGKPSVLSIPAEAQGEAIGYSLDGNMLVTTSEGSPCQVSALRPKG